MPHFEPWVLTLLGVLGGLTLNVVANLIMPLVTSLGSGGLRSWRSLRCFFAAAKCAELELWVTRPQALVLETIARSAMMLLTAMMLLSLFQLVTKSVNMDAPTGGVVGNYLAHMSPARQFVLGGLSVIVLLQAWQVSALHLFSLRPMHLVRRAHSRLLQFDRLEDNPIEELIVARSHCELDLLNPIPGEETLTSDLDPSILKGRAVRGPVGGRPRSQSGL